MISAKGLLNTLDPWHRILADRAGERVNGKSYSGQACKVACDSASSKKQVKMCRLNFIWNFNLILLVKSQVINESGGKNRKNLSENTNFCRFSSTCKFFELPPEPKLSCKFRYACLIR